MFSPWFAARRGLAGVGTQTGGVAGSGLHAPFAETTEAQFEQMMAEHLKAPFFLTQKLLPLLADGGRIINISSGLARFSLPGHAAYAAMKGRWRCSAAIRRRSWVRAASP